MRVNLREIDAFFLLTLFSVVRFTSLYAMLCAGVDDEWTPRARIINYNFNYFLKCRVREGGTRKETYYDHKPT